MQSFGGLENLESRQFFSGSLLVITHGGTYSGDFESDDPNTPAITIDTDQPVIIRDSIIRSKSDLITNTADHVHLTVVNCRAYGLNPDVEGQAPGRFINLDSFSSVLVKNNYIEGTGGIYLHHYLGDYTSQETVNILYNQVRNIDGRKSDGQGGFMDFNTRTNRITGDTEDGFVDAQFVQFDQVRGVWGAQIAWNEVINVPGQSRVEDNINIYSSSGQRRHPILIHDNYIQGAFTISPAQGSYSDDTYDYDWSYSGGGIMVGDGPSLQTADQATAYVRAYYNQVINTTNYGIAIASGHDLSFNDNRIISCGHLDDGRRIYASNVGAYIWNSNNDSSDLFFNNWSSHNLVGWVRQNQRADTWMPDSSIIDNNTSIAGKITQRTQRLEYAFWGRRQSRAGVKIGVQTA